MIGEPFKTKLASFRKKRIPDERSVSSAVYSTPDPPPVGSFVVFLMLDPAAVGFVSHGTIVDLNHPANTAFSFVVLDAN